jgi:hypothetical protein
VSEDSRRLVYRIPRSTGEADLGEALPIVRVQAARFEHDWPLMHDGHIETGWTNHPFEPGAHITIDLGVVSGIGGVTHATGDFARHFPAAIAIETSTDGQTWERAWEGSLAAKAFLAYVREPRTGRLRVAFPARQARYLRLRQLATDDRVWRVSEVTVHAPVRERR